MRYRLSVFASLACALLHSVAAHSEVLRFKSEVTPSEQTAIIQGALEFPKGDGPFPLVILMHPCGGLERFALGSLRAHATELGRAGFATLILDSYGSRKGWTGGDACGKWTASFRRDDAFNAMAMLMLNPKVSKQNMFLMGQSDGAIAALLSARGRSDRQFRAVAAYYPDCGLLSGTEYIIRSPLIVFVAERDDWTPPSQCTKAKDTGIVKGAEYELVAYKDAHHGFDQPRSPIKYKGHTLAYDREATIDSQKRMTEFFLKQLTGDIKATLPSSSRSQ
jgi:dienelactone hydrolase